jgi:integration host factor subunit alpha
MTKAEILDAVYERVGNFSKKEAAEVVEAVFDTMKEVLADGQKIKISGFGNFVVRAKKQRIGRNPQTGDPIPISARRVLTFKPSQVLKGILNPHKDFESDGAPRAEGQPKAVPVPAGSPGTAASVAATVPGATASGSRDGSSGISG